MALFRNLETRYFNLHGKRTSLAIEPIFWQVAEKQARQQSVSLKKWLNGQLVETDKNRASALRVAILSAVMGRGY